MKAIVKRIKENSSQALQIGYWGAFGGGMGSLLIDLIRGPLSTYFRRAIAPLSTSFFSSLFSLGIWYATISGMITLSLLMGYSSYLKRGLRIGESIIQGILLGLFTGFCVYLIAEFIYSYNLISPTNFLGMIFWGIAGGLLGSGFSFLIPNFVRIRGFLGGGIGGIIGYILSSFIFSLLGGAMGRLLGLSALGFLIGLMIILVEVAFRPAWLVVKWSSNEDRTLSLGSKPILLGCAAHADIYLRQDQGYAPVTAKVYMEKNKILMQYNSKYGEEEGMKKLTHELQNGDKLKFGSVSLEVESTNH